MTTIIDDDFGEFTFVAHNLTVGQSCFEKHSVLPDDPNSVTSECRWDFRQSRPGWHINVSTFLEVTCDGDYFYLVCGVDALENDEQVYQKKWQEKISRGFS